MPPNKRIAKELAMISRDPAPGISCSATDEGKNRDLEGVILGPEDSPYARGTFRLSVGVSERYPFEPPRVRFITPIYHPNIDSDGRICLDTLKPQPQGSWSPATNINTLLLSIRLLMARPNADDGLVPDITEQYRTDLAGFRVAALAHTLRYAIPQGASATSNVVAASNLGGAASETAARDTKRTLSESESQLENDGANEEEIMSDFAKRAKTEEGGVVTNASKQQTEPDGSEDVNGQKQSNVFLD